MGSCSDDACHETPQDALSGLTFQPGQWVDFHAPGVQHVGGYSICSTPQDLQRLGTFELCVKASRHPCAQWVHQQAVAGDKVGSWMPPPPEKGPPLPKSIGWSRVGTRTAAHVLCTSAVGRR